MMSAIETILNLAQTIPAPQLPKFLAALEEVRVVAWCRLTAQPQQEVAAPDRLVDIEEAEERLGLSRSYIYRHANEFSFTRRQGKRKLLFSANGIDRYIREH